MSVQKRAAAAIELAAMASIGAAAVVAWTGGWRFELFGFAVSLRSAWRLAAAGAVLFALRGAMARRSGSDFPREIADAAGRTIAGAAIAAAVIGWLAHLSPYVGGADSYGYVSAAGRIRAGDLIHHEPLADLLPYREPILAATPLGYVPTVRAANANVPAYPLGLPAVMAVALIAGGGSAPFYLSPLAGVLLIAVCALAVYRWSADTTTALAAGAAVAFHPVVFTYAIQPMSDVPAAACFLLAALLMACGRSSLLAGAAASLSFLIRPALLPGAAALVLLVPLHPSRRLARVMSFGALIAVGVALQAWSQWYLYGSALANGYGPALELFSLRFLPANARSYAHWSIALHGVLWFGGVVLALLRLGSVRHRALLAAPFLIGAAPYAVYRTYDHWETLRFVLPLLVAATCAAVAAVALPAGGVGNRARSWLAVLFAAAWVVTSVRWLDREHVFERWRSEERYARTGELVARVTPRDAVIIASLHSGSVRYYSARDTLDWGRIPEGRFSETVDALERAGRAVFVLIDGQQEQAQFVARHGAVLDTGKWLPSGQVRDVRVFQSPR